MPFRLGTITSALLLLQQPLAHAARLRIRLSVLALAAKIAPSQLGEIGALIVHM
jgi:hypothetical protein